MELIYEQAFDAARYPELQEKTALLEIVESKVKGMRLFMDKMKGGVRNMRSIVEHEGVTYEVVLKI